MAGNQFGVFLTNLGIKNPVRKNVGYGYTPFTVQQGQSTPGQSLFDKVGNRVASGESIYNANRQEVTNRVASDVAGKSAFNVPTDEFGLVNQELTDFRPMFTKQIQSVGQRGQNALAAAQARNAYKQALAMQDLGQYGFTGGISVSGNGTSIPGAASGNPGARAAEMAMQVQKSGTPYVWGGNSLVKGIDCSGLVQQIYRQMGISIPRQTYDQAKSGKVVSVNDVRPGDLVFYGGNNHHVGIYVGNGKIVHAANSRLGVITSNLYNTNGAPHVIIRPY
jgi:cell wall-associated NlpC family hydrolase